VSVLREPAPSREEWAEELLDRLTPFMSALGILFLLLVLGDLVATPGSPLSLGLTVANWVLWAVFAGEFVARMVVAPSTRRFLRRNWWQLVFLALPFLRFLRLIRLVRLGRAGRVLSSAVRSSRSARRLLGNRVAWLGVLTAITILSSSQLLHQLGSYERYGDALHAATLAAVAGEPLPHAGGWERVLEVGLVVFSVAVFATLAGALGAYFLRREE
jgi:voltage-gated potassium channel